MPNLVAYLHVRLNLNITEDAEIYRNLTKLPEGDRSRMVRTALLEYFKGEISGKERRTKRTKVSQVDPGSRTKEQIVPAVKQEEVTAGAIDNELQPTKTKKDLGAALSDMLDLIK